MMKKQKHGLARLYTKDYDWCYDCVCGRKGIREKEYREHMRENGFQNLMKRCC